MRIQSVQNKPYYQKTPTFTHWNRTVYKLGTSTGIENVIRRNNTTFFRDPEFWLDLAEFLDKKLKNVPKMNVYSYGCSDGSDPLTLVLVMLAHRRENLLEKFSPIIAKDVDPVAIERAESNIYEISPWEYMTIDRYTCGKFNKFFKDFESHSDLVPEANFIVSPDVTKYVRFSEANVVEDYKKIEPKNSVVLLRNVLPYINASGNEPYYTGEDWRFQEEFLKKLYNHLDESSYIAIGIYDQYEMKKDLPAMLRKAGFEETNIPKLYRRLPEKEKNKILYYTKKILKFFQ